MFPKYLHRVSLARPIRIALVLSIATQALFAQSVEVGKPAPALAIAEWIRGEPLPAFERGKPCIVALWSSACEACMEHVETFNRLQTRFECSGLRVIVVASRLEDPRATLASTKEFVKAQGDALRFTVAWDIDTRTTSAYLPAKAVSAHPATFVDAQGNVAYIGLPHECEAMLVALEYVAWDRAKAERLFEEFQRIHRFSSASPAPGEPVVQAALDADVFRNACPPLAALVAHVHFDLLLRAGRLEDAYALGSKAVELAIADGDAGRLNNLAWSIVDPDVPIQRRDLDLALRAASKAVELSKEREWWAFSSLAWVHFTRGDVQKAIELQRKAMQLTDDPEPRLSLEKFEAAARAAGAPAKKGG